MKKYIRKKNLGIERTRNRKLKILIEKYKEDNKNFYEKSSTKKENFKKIINDKENLGIGTCGENLTFIIILFILIFFIFFISYH